MEILDLKHIKGKTIINVLTYPDEGDRFSLILDDGSQLDVSAKRWEANRPDPNSIFWIVYKHSQVCDRD